MRIIQLTPGSGDNFYCENCIRDLVLVRAVRSGGHDMLMVPMYLPLNLDSAESAVKTPIFFGGVNVYLQQKFSFFRKTPRWLDKLFDSRRLLEWVGKMSGMTSAEQLGEMTLSMLEGPQGYQVKEVDRLIEFLSTPEHKPDVLLLSNMLLAGLAGPIKERLGCKLVGWLQDEDGFVDGLGSPWAEKVWAAMKKKVPYFDLFLPVSHYYAGLMQRRLGIPDDKLSVFTPGIDMSQYEAVGVLPEVPTVGFLGRMCPANGLDIAVSAFTELMRSQEQLSDAKLVISGGKTSADDSYIQEQKKSLSNAGLIDKSYFFEEFDLEARLSFFKEISLLCSPSRQPPAYALNVMEAAACGVPFVAPKAGVFTEWAELTGAGIVYEPNTPEEVQKVIQSLLVDADKSKEMAQKGRQAALEHFDVRKNAEKLVTRLSEIK